MNITCPACFATNRVSESRLVDKPNCGRCKKALFKKSPRPMDDASAVHYFKHNDLPLIVDFWADWCGPCKQMSIEFGKATALLEPQFRLVKVDVDKSKMLAQQFNIRSIPTLVLVKKGTEIARHVGAMSSTELVQWVNSSL